MSGARNLHRIAGALERMRREAVAGPCGVCAHSDPPRPEPLPSAGFIEDWAGYPTGVCERHAKLAPEHGYTVHRPHPEEGWT